MAEIVEGRFAAGYAEKLALACARLSLERACELHRNPRDGEMCVTLGMDVDETLGAPPP